MKSIENYLKPLGSGYGPSRLAQEDFSRKPSIPMRSPSNYKNAY